MGQASDNRSQTFGKLQEDAEFIFDVLRLLASDTFFAPFERGDEDMHKLKSKLDDNHARGKQSRNY